MTLLKSALRFANLVLDAINLKRRKDAENNPAKTIADNVDADGVHKSEKPYREPSDRA